MNANIAPGVKTPAREPNRPMTDAPESDRVCPSCGTPVASISCAGPGECYAAPCGHRVPGDLL
jgi:hypothetical protein